MWLKVAAYYVGVLIVLLAGFAFGAVLLFVVQGTNVMLDSSDHVFVELYLWCIPFIAALIAIPNAIKRFKGET